MLATACLLLYREMNSYFCGHRKHSLQRRKQATLSFYPWTRKRSYPLTKCGCELDSVIHNHSRLHIIWNNPQKGTPRIYSISWIAVRLKQLNTGEPFDIKGGITWLVTMLSGVRHHSFRKYSSSPNSQIWLTAWDLMNLSWMNKVWQKIQPLMN